MVSSEVAFSDGDASASCSVCNQSTVSVFRGKLMQPLCEPGSFSTASSPRRLAREKKSEQLVVTGKDEAPPAARGRDTSSVSPGWRALNGNEKCAERLGALGDEHIGSTAMFRVQPRSST